MTCRIEWNKLTPTEWDQRFGRIRRSNILQAYEYALAICPLERKKARWGLIKIDDKEAGLVQILEAGALGNLLHAVILDRGPLWYNGFGSDEDSAAFLKAFKKSFPRRLGRKIRFIPEREDVEAVMSGAGYKKQPTQPYQTIWLDLTKDDETLKAALKKNWRNMLSRAEKEGIETSFEFKTECLKDMLTKYAYDKAQKGFSGPNVEYIVALSKTFAPMGKLLLARAHKKGAKNDDALGYALFFIHGNSATYQIGWTGAEGRSTGVQNKILWDAVAELKQRGITDLDLGGVNDDTAKGVKTFKEGMGGELICYSGLYC